MLHKTRRTVLSVVLKRTLGASNSLHLQSKKMICGSYGVYSSFGV